MERVWQFQLLNMNACILCHSDLLDSFEAKPGGRYFFCGNCSYLCLDPELRLDRLGEKERYEEHNNDLQDDRYIGYLTKTWEKVADRVPKDALVVDYGCGPSKGLETALKGQLFQVISYDPIFFPSGLELFFRKVDVIYCSEAIEHMFDPISEIETWMKLLKPNGLITLRTSFHSGPEHFKDWHYKNDPTHIGFFNEKTFKYLADRFELEILHIHSPYVSFRRRS